MVIVRGHCTKSFIKTWKIASEAEFISRRLNNILLNGVVAKGSEPPSYLTIITSTQRPWLAVFVILRPLCIGFRPH